jgi:hypothetical protein
MQPHAIPAAAAAAATSAAGKFRLESTDALEMPKRLQRGCSNLANTHEVTDGGTFAANVPDMRCCFEC